MKTFPPCADSYIGHSHENTIFLPVLFRYLDMAGYPLSYRYMSPLQPSNFNMSTPHLSAMMTMYYKHRRGIDIYISNI